MTFTFSVAGPSRLPAQAAVRCGRRLGRRQASADAASTARAANEDSPAGPAIEDKESKAARKKEKELWATHDGYIRWLKTDASKFREVTKGEKVTWLGGAVPYGTNPSFKPPSPLGNDTQEHIFSQLSRKNRTIAQVAEQFNISKARIDAIRKLKDVEREMVRQGLPLQQAFQEGMEPLLGIKTLRDAKSKIISDRLARDEASQRGATMGSRVEREEEERYEAGIGQGGAFSSEAAEIGSLERTVWEFRSEEMTMGERTAEAAARQAVSHDGLAAKLLAGVEAAPPTPESKQDTRPVSHERETPSHEHRTKRTMFRFIDTSTIQRAGSRKQGTQRS